MKNDPYTDKNGVLINKFFCSDREKLAEIEKIFTTTRIIELEEKPIIGNYDLEHLQKIHEYIFQDIYEWAGKVRTVPISKEKTVFCLPEHITTYGQTIFDQLKKENYLKGLDSYNFCRKGAYYLGEINMLHPFREGNGRTQRQFIKDIARQAGYKINFKYVNDKQMKAASIRSATTDNKGFYDILKNNITRSQQKSRSR